MSLNLASLNQRYNYLLSLVNSIITGLIPVSTSSPLSVVLTNGNSAGTTDINMNNNDILNVDILDVNGTSTFGNAVVLDASNQINRQFTTSYVNFSRTNNTTFQNADCRIFSLGGGENMFLQQITGTNISFAFLLPTAKTALTITPDELIGFANITVNGDNRSLRFISTNGATFFRISQTQSPSRLNFNTTNVNGDYLFNSFNGTSATPLLSLSNTNNTSFLDFIIASNRNLVMNTGSGRIVQAIPTTEVSDGESNLLKKTIISSNFPGATNNSFTNEIFDVTSGRGVRFVCNAGAGGYSPSTLAGDTVVLSRFRPPATPSVGFVFTLPSGTANIRIGSSDVGRGTIRIQAVNNQIDIDDDATQPDFAVSVLGSIRMTSTNALKRRINNVSNFGMFDIAGLSASSTSNFFVNSTNGVQYQNGIQASRGHSFFPTNSLGVLNRRFEIQDTSVSVQETNFQVRSSVDTTNITLNANSSGLNNVSFTNNSPGTTSSAVFSCTDASQVSNNVITMTPTSLTIQQPLLTTSVASNLTHTGFTDTITVTTNNVDNVGINPLASVSVTAVGTYQLIASVALVNPSLGQNITFSGAGGTLGFGTANNNLTGYPSSLTLDPDFVLGFTKTKRIQCVMIDRNTTGAKTYFLNGNTVYASPAGKILQTVVSLTICKIY